MNPLDVADPMGALDRALDPLAGLDRLLGVRKRRREAKYPVLTPEEETSLIDATLAKGANLLQYVGETLDKPGRAVRGLVSGTLDTMAGNPNPEWGGGALNLIPFSDTMGLTDPRKAVEGRTLLTKLGAPENREGFFNSVEDSLWDVGGLATEIALDPLTYVGLGAVTKAGKAAQRAAIADAKAASKAGQIVKPLTEGLAEQVAKGERSLLSFGFGDNAAHWTGPGSASKVAEIIDPAWEFVRKSGPGRTLARWFDPSVMDMQTELGQELATKRYGLAQELQADALTPAYQDYHRLRKSGGLTPDAEDIFRQSMEGVPLDPARLAKIDPALQPQLVVAGRASGMRQAPFIGEATRVGLNEEALDDIIGYGARYHHADVPGAFAEVLDAVRGRPNMKLRGRYEEFKNLPLGTTQVNDIINGRITDPRTGRSVWQMTEDEARPWLASLYETIDKNGNRVPMDPAKAEELANKFYQHTHSLDRARYDVAIAGDKAKRLYNAHGLIDEVKRTSQHIKRTTYADMAHEMAASASLTEDQLIRQFGGVPADAVDMEVALDRLGINFQGKGMERAKDYMAQLPGRDPFKGGKRFILKEHFDDMQRLAKAWQTPESLKGIARLYDAFQNLWKTAVTSVWPSFHVRNVIGGLAYHWMSPAADNPIGMIEPFLEAKRVLKDGGDFSPRTLEIMRNASPDFKNVRTTEDAIGIMLANQFVRPDGQFAQTFHSVEDQLHRGMSGGIPAKPRTVGETIKETIKEEVEQGFDTYRRRTRPVAKPFQDVNELVSPNNPLFDDYIIGDLKRRTRSNTAQQKRFDMLTGAGVPPEQAARMTRRKFGSVDRPDLLAAPDGTIIGKKQTHVADDAARVEYYERAVRTLGLTPEDAAARTRAYFGDPTTLDPIPETLTRKGRFGKAVEAVSATADTVSGIGRAFGQSAEDIMRLGHGIAMISKGATASEARQSIAKWFFNYGEMTQFDKQVMRRLFPFWGWAKNNTPLVFKELIQNPGGKLAQTIRATNEARGGTGYVPEWVGGGGTVIPVGGTEGRYITSLGLPFESALEWTIHPNALRSVQRNLERTVSSMAPPIRLGYSLTTTRDPLSGRDLRDLYQYPFSGSLASIPNAMLANSPASRGISTFRKIQDERKSWGDLGLDLLTGVKVTDVSGGLENARARETQQALREAMRDTPGLRQNISYYVDSRIPQDEVPKKVSDMLRLDNTLRQRFKKQQKERRLREAGGVVQP